MNHEEFLKRLSEMATLTHEELLIKNKEMLEAELKPKVTRNHSPETRAKIAATMKGNKNAETSKKYKAVKKRQKAKRKPRTLTAEHKRKIGNAIKKNTYTDKFRKVV